MGSDEGRGRTLEELLRRERSLPLGEIGPVIEGVLGALVALHARGQVHRNVQPATILLVDGGVRLSDEGTSKARSSRSSHAGNEPSLEAVEATLGSFAFMAPEQRLAMGRGGNAAASASAIGARESGVASRESRVAIALADGRELDGDARGWLGAGGDRERESRGARPRLRA